MIQGQIAIDLLLLLERFCQIYLITPQEEEKEETIYWKDQKNKWMEEPSLPSTYSNFAISTKCRRDSVEKQT